MKKMLFTAIMLLMAVMANAKDIKTVVLTTDPIMHCVNCENKVKENLKYVSGIKDIVACAETQSITVTYDADKTSVEKMQASLKKAGYTATVKPTCEKECCKQNAEKKECCKQNADKQCGGKCKEAAEKKECCKQNAEKQCDGKCKEAAEKKECCKQNAEKQCDGKCKEAAEKKECCKQNAEKQCDGKCKK